MTPQSTVRLALIHPLAITCIALLLVNDHVLKEHWPGVLTGKLSDIAGLVFFPLLVVAVVDLVIGRSSRTIISAIAVVATGLGFLLIQTYDPAADLYRHTLGYLQWPLRLLFHGAVAPVPVDHTADATDLLALPALLIAWRLSRDNSNRGPRDRGEQIGRAAVGS